MKLIFWCVLGLAIQMSICANPKYDDYESENCRDDAPNKDTMYEKIKGGVSKVRDFLVNPFNIFRRRIFKLVYGGNKAKIEHYPHQVSLYYKNYFLCGGSIIGDRYILTAAHCFDNTEPNPKKWKVGTGTSYLSEDDVTYCISKYFIHPRYNKATVDYDVAILRTTKPIDLSGRSTKAVQLPDSDKSLLPDDIVIVTGYGSQTGLDEPSIQLRAVKLSVISNEICKNVWMSTYGMNITPRMFCAGHNEGGKSACYRDSGGPVVSEDGSVQYGIVSFGPEGCDERGIPNVFTNVTEVRSWITHITGI